MAEMDPEAGASSQRRAFPRVPLRAKVQMEFAEQRCFLGEWAVNLSPGGMFVRSEALMSAGQRFQFEASLTMKGPRFGGVGQVMWVRKEWEGNARPPGFAVRFLELDEDGRSTLTRLADVFLEQGVAAMQDELTAMSAAWQRRRLDEESTDELQPPPEEPEEPLPDTAVLQAPWVAAATNEIATAKVVQAEVAAAAAEAAADGAEAGDGVSTPAVAEPVEPPAPATPAAAPATGRRRVWWVGVLALLLGGTGYVVLRGPLAGWVRSGATGGGDAVDAALPAAPPGMAPGGEAAAGPKTFAGLDDVTWSEDVDGLWVVLALDGALPADSLHRYRTRQDPPREVIQLLGARRGYAKAVVPVHSPLLEQIRVGFHPGDGDELRVVLDLTSPAVVLRSMRTDGQSLRLLLAREEGAMPPASEGMAAEASAPAAVAPGPGAAETAPLVPAAAPAPSPAPSPAPPTQPR
jgi:uncharacterized protein (TIGR02266 family)